MMKAGDLPVYRGFLAKAARLGQFVPEMVSVCLKLRRNGEVIKSTG